MVAGSDTKTGREIVGNGPDGGRKTERRPVGSDEASNRNTDNEGDVEPVDVLVPILSRDREISDVRLARVVGLVSVWLLLLGRW